MFGKIFGIFLFYLVIFQCIMLVKSDECSDLSDAKRVLNDDPVAESFEYIESLEEKEWLERTCRFMAYVHSIDARYSKKCLRESDAATIKTEVAKREKYCADVKNITTGKPCLFYAAGVHATLCDSKFGGSRERDTLTHKNENYYYSETPICCFAKDYVPCREKFVRLLCENEDDVKKYKEYLNEVAKSSICRNYKCPKIPKEQTYSDGEEIIDPTVKPNKNPRQVKDDGGAASMPITNYYQNFIIFLTMIMVLN